jgi:DNA-binding transcriptional ArsR family regulator
MKNSSYEEVFTCGMGIKNNLTDVCYVFFSNLANPTRLAILDKLRFKEMNVTEIAKLLGQEQSMVSHNLRTLEQCAFVKSERKGKEKLYRINGETVETLFKTVENTL